MYSMQRPADRKVPLAAQPARELPRRAHRFWCDGRRRPARWPPLLLLLLLCPNGHGGQAGGGRSNAPNRRRRPGAQAHRAEGRIGASCKGQDHITGLSTTAPRHTGLVKRASRSPAAVTHVDNTVPPSLHSVCAVRRNIRVRARTRCALAGLPMRCLSPPHPTAPRASPPPAYSHFTKSSPRKGATGGTPSRISSSMHTTAGEGTTPKHIWA